MQGPREPKATKGPVTVTAYITQLSVAAAWMGSLLS
jgi:hypothetical protein